MKEKLKKITPLKYGMIVMRGLRREHSLSSSVRRLNGFFSDLRASRHLPANDHFPLKTSNLYPRIHDKTGVTHVDPVYFYQDTWCCRKIFDAKPVHHYDIGSSAEMVGIISQFTPTTMIDIRPLNVSLPELSFIKGDILHLPFKDNEIESLSSICVIEHIGLGRYGDALDSFGSEKALAEMIRVLKPGGNLYLSVPIDKENKVYFNAHRAFSPAYIKELCAAFELIEEHYIYGNALGSHYDPVKGFGTGLYHFHKPLL